MKKILLIILIFASYILNSCVNSSEYNKIKKDFKNVTYNSNYDNLDSVYISLPTYEEITKSILKHKLVFNSELLLQPENAESYYKSKEVALGLGMYIADLGYARHFERVQLCMNYMQAVKILSQRLAINEQELNTNISTLENNIDDNQKLFQIIDSLFDKADVFLSQNEKYGLAALIVSGIWIEITYIGLQTDCDNENYIDVLSEHFKILSQINKLLFTLQDDDTILKLKNLLFEVESKKISNPSLYSDIKTIRNTFAK